MVPQLCGNSYDADELHDDHPVRFTNEGLQLDHQPQNAVEWYVKIPHREDYHLWIPARANPDQQEWLEAVYADDAKMGESRLFERDGTWYLHITVTRDVADQSAASAEERTPIGVDIGEASLVTVCHRDGSGSPVRPDCGPTTAKPFVGFARPTSPPRDGCRSVAVSESQSPTVTHCGTRLTMCFTV